MAIKVNFDIDDNPIQPRLILATRSGNRIRELPIEQIVFRDTLTNGSEFSFVINKQRCVDKNGDIDESFWRRITDFKLAYCPEYDMWYEIYVKIDEDDETVKNCSATSLGEAELSQINVYGIEVNTEADIEREDYHPTVFYNPNTPSVSLVDRLLYKAPHYRIDHVDQSLWNIQRTFTFDNTTIYDAYQTVAKEIDCLFVFECTKGTDSKIDRKISVYDLENVCLVCGERGDFISECPNCGSTSLRHGYGDDTSIYIDKDNLADGVTYETDVASVKNCFRLEAGDDLMTATVINCNPNGSQYIWYITDEMREDMSPALQQRLHEYDVAYEAYQTSASWSPPPGLLSEYNEIVQKYKSRNPDLQEIPSPIVGFPALMTAYYNTIDLQLYLNNSLMPNVQMETTDAHDEAAKITSAALTPVAVANLSSCTEATASSAVLGMAKCLISTRFQIKAQNGAYDTSTHYWTGEFVLTNYSDEEDTATSATVTVLVNEDMEKYINQKLKRAMKQKSDDTTDISSVFALDGAAFANALKNYSLQRLLTFRDACQVSLDILIQQGVADSNSWVDSQHDLYQTMYLPYLAKMRAIESEVLVRTQEIGVVAGIYDDNGGLLYPGMQSEIDAHRKAVQEIQDFEAFIGPTLWEEFASYRREDSFSNPNYISDGLNNEELFARALEFVDIAQKEIYSSAVLQHTLTAEMHNLLAMREFQDIVPMFKTGNWVRLGVDGKIYRLRLSEYDINYNGWTLDVKFTDVKYGHNSASDIEDILNSAKNMSTSYGSVARQAEDGKRSSDIMQNWVQEGFSLTTKLVGGADHQEFVIDESGITGREYIQETGEYADEQIRVISHGLYVTDDGWITAKAGVGKFSFYNPQTHQYEEAFGVIANTLVGNLILSQNVGIYNQSGSITLDDDGFTLITEAGQDAKVFRIIRREPDGTLTNVLNLDAYGNLALNINSSIGDGMTFEDLATKDDAIADVDVEYAVNDSSSTPPESGWSTTSPQWESGRYVWQRTKTISGSNIVAYSSPVCIQGAQGINGLNTAIVYLYKRASSAPSIDWTSTLVYSFSTHSLSYTPPGWYDSIPSGTDPLYVTAATASSLTNVDNIPYTEFATPVMMAQNGTIGQNGINTATVFLYQRSSTVPTKPSTNLTYTFATGVLSGTLGNWSQTVPTSNGDPCYSIQATAISQDATDTIASTEWSNIVRFVADGEEGIGISSIEEQYYLSTSSSTQTGGSWSTEQPIWASGYYIWTRSKITWDDGAIAYTDPVLAKAVNSANQTAYDTQTDLHDNYSDTNAMNAAIYAGVEGIRTEVSNSITQMATQFSQTDSELAMRVATNEENIGTTMTTFRVTSEGAEISKTTSDATLVLHNDQIEMRVNGDVVTYWNLNEQYTPKMVQIPVGGSLRLGSVQFQPRSSGNLSLLWVGT